MNLHFVGLLLAAQVIVITSFMASSMSRFSANLSPNHGLKSFCSRIQTGRERFFGPSGCPLNYQTPCYNIAPVDLLISGGIKDLHVRGVRYHEKHPCGWRWIFVDEKRKIIPRGSDALGFSGLWFNAWGPNSIMLLEDEPLITVLRAGTALPEGLKLTQPFPKYLGRFCLEPSVQCSVRGFNSALKKFSSSLEEMDFAKVVFLLDK